jgi:hypothetical protein
MTKLEAALRKFFGPDRGAGSLARVLDYACTRGRVSYDEAQTLIEEGADDVLLLASELRLLVPMRTLRSAAWEDRIFLAEPGAIYEMPHVVRFLVQNARQSGQWNPADALRECFRLAGEPEWERIPIVVDRIGQRSEAHRINARQIKEVCDELGLGHRVDVLIAEVKGTGVMSPKLGSLAEVARIGAPIYELNPCLFRKKGEEKKE